MTALRSFAFQVFYYASVSLCAILFLALLPLPRRVMQSAVRAWSAMMIAGLGVLAGTRFEVRGAENRIVDGPVIYASKHQSAWDTAIFYLLCRDPVYVLKQELLDIPVWGWLARKAGMIAVDRAGGAAALKAMVRSCQEALAHGRQVIVFPEGTRTTPGRHYPYHPGIAALAAAGGVPVVPVALNSGMFWGRHSFHRYPGVITVEFLKAMPEGLKHREFVAELKGRVDAAADRLAVEAKDRFGLPEPQGRDAERAA